MLNEKTQHPEPQRRPAQAPETRATQHLLLQGFTLYTCAAAVCTRLVAPGVLDDPNNAWSVLFDSKAQSWTSQLPEGDRLLAVFADAAVRATKLPHVVCHVHGCLLTVPLDVADVRDARMRIEAAFVLGKAPAAERLEAFPDELIEREAARRAAKRQGAPERSPERSV